MLKKGDVKAVSLVVVGVMIAGFAMYNLRSFDLIAQARAGYDT